MWRSNPRMRLISWLSLCVYLSSTFLTPRIDKLHTLEIHLMHVLCVYSSSPFMTPRIDTLHSLSHHAFEPVPQAIVGSDPRSVSP